MFESIIKPEAKIVYETYSGRMEAELKREIEDYVSHSGFEHFQDFITAACQFTLSKDKNWQKFKKEQHKQAKNAVNTLNNDRDV